jgi:lipid A 3-O-deacylase
LRAVQEGLDSIGCGLEDHLPTGAGAVHDLFDAFMRRHTRLEPVVKHIGLHSIIFKLTAVIIAFLLVSGIPGICLAEEDSTYEIPTRYGLAGVMGKTFDPVTDIRFIQLSGFAMWDYDKIWRHWAPDPLRFKLECTAGATTTPKTRPMISVGMMALYYLDFFSTSRLLPYLEGGIGVIYTDFQVVGQGSRFNFNPQIGFGTEFKWDSGPPFFGTLRLHHISNGGLNEENRGVNSLVLMIGRFL